MDRIVVQRAEVEMLEFLSAVLGGLRYPGRTGHDRDRIADRIIARTALRTATYERRRLEQHIRNGSDLIREPAANGAKRKPDANPHAVGTDSLDRKATRSSMSESGRRTEQRHQIVRYELPVAAGNLGHAATFPADVAAQHDTQVAQVLKLEHLARFAAGMLRRPSAALDLRKRKRPDTPCKAIQFFSSQDEFPETYTETNKHAKYPGETKRGGRRATTAPECLRRTAKRRLSDPGQPLPTDMMLGYADLVHPAAGVERFEVVRIDARPVIVVPDPQRGRP